MTVKIRLKKAGRKKDPHYKVVAVDSRKKRDGRVLDYLGHYHPQDRFPNLVVDMERYEHFIKTGAQVTDTVRTLINKLKRNYVEPEEGKPKKPAPDKVKDTSDAETPVATAEPSEKTEEQAQEPAVEPSADEKPAPDEVKDTADAEAPAATAESSEKTKEQAQEPAVEPSADEKTDTGEESGEPSDLKKDIEKPETENKKEESESKEKEEIKENSPEEKAVSEKDNETGEKEEK